jgi:hypothetical protein
MLRRFSFKKNDAVERALTEEVREFVERGDYTINVPTTQHVEQELKSP